MSRIGKQAVCALLIAAAVACGFRLARIIASPASGSDRSQSIRRAYELRRAQAHRRMENTLYASTPSPLDEASMCPALFDGGPSLSIEPDRRRGFRVKSASESALAFFLNRISGPIVQAKCVNCHVEGGLSGHTRLIFQPSSNPDHAARNLAAIRNFLATVEGGANRILNKIQGVGHGGGIQVPAGSDDFANMASFLGLLGYDGGLGPGLSPETLFDTVTMASPGKTLRRAALIFGGRIPTREELEAVESGTEEDLREAIRNLMRGPGFHQFLIRASNDRLLTDRELSDAIPLTTRFVDFSNLHWAKAMAAIEKGYRNPWEDPEYGRWVERVHYGFGRAPLELIAHVVENDRPYTEVLTADYIMANPEASQAYGASVRFDDPKDPTEFRPSEILSYYRDDDSKVAEFKAGFEWRILDPGNLWTDYPHAGILNTTVFLRRYPTTPTNRNRARSRWTYYHFLGLDIEKSASRTTDPEALADTDNPTMKNPACTVCHRIMDPVAGAYQNYGEQGEYRDTGGGQDSLDDFYKDPPDGGYTPYQPGDTWYRDMREPGFNGMTAPDADNSVQWLAEQIAADERFAEATVKFWWPAILGVEVVRPPEDRNDSGFEAMLLASNAQTAEVERLAAAFRAGIAGGASYNLKDLLVEIVLSPWFRAELLADDHPVRAAALRIAGVERLLTPEELAWKTHAITGYQWGRRLEGIEASSDLTREDNYRLLYGGIDSDGITERANEMTALMAAVAQSHAVEVSCPIVRREFLLWPEEKRRLFGGIDWSVSPVSEVSATAVISARSWRERQTNSWAVTLAAGDKTVRLGFMNDFWDEATGADRNLILDRVIIRDQSGAVVELVELETLDPIEVGGPLWEDSGYILWSEGWLDVPVSIPADGDYRVEVVAYQQAAGEESAMLEIVVESDIDTSRGAREIRNKLVELHEKLLGVTVDVDSPEVEAAFRLFVDVWERKRYANDDGPDWREDDVNCDIGDQLYFEGIADDILQVSRHDNGNLYLDFDWDRVDEIFDKADYNRPDPVIRTWVVALAYLLMDYRYLFL